MNFDQTQIDTTTLSTIKYKHRYHRLQLNNIIPIVKILAHKCKVCLKYPIFRILKAIFRRFRLNQIEALFFLYLVRKTDWNIDDPVISGNSRKVKSIITFVDDHEEYRNLILYLTLLSYSIKECLNSKNIFLGVANRICPDFIAIFQKWSFRFSDIAKEINPRTINQLFIASINQDRLQRPDYIHMADQIIKMSPAYSFTRNQEELEKAEALQNEDEEEDEMIDAQMSEDKIEKRDGDNQLQATFAGEKMNQFWENEDESVSNTNGQEDGLRGGKKKASLSIYGNANYSNIFKDDDYDLSGEEDFIIFKHPLDPFGMDYENEYLRREADLFDCLWG